MSWSSGSRLQRLIAGALFFLAALPLHAQTNRARAIVTVVDQSGAVVPDATVTLVGLDDATKANTIAPAKTSDKGVATLENLTPGRYAIHADFPGFEQGLLKDIRLRTGDNKHVVVLPIKKMESEVTVGRDAQAVAADPRARFGTALTREQIEALSDDPAEMAQQLADMAGPNAVIRVDSFEGAQLPLKSQIKSIHITRDAFAAENHSAGQLFIDIITQPGIGALRGFGNMRLRDGALSARSPFATRKGPENLQQYFGNIGGSLMKNKASFSLGINGSTQYITPNAFTYIPGYGQFSEPLPIKQPSDNLGFNGLFDYALTRDQTLRVSVNHNSGSSDNLGIGGNDSIERAYSNNNSFTGVRIQEAGPLGRRFFMNTRLMIGRTSNDQASEVEAVTYRVVDARTTGGAQIRGGRHGTTFSLQSDLDYVRGIHSLRTGISVDGGSYFSDDESNYLGTYLFDSPTAFEAGTPLNYTRRLGDSAIDYNNVQAGIYVQDDIRLRKNLTFSPGVRYELQTHLSDYNNFGPRFGMSWAPFKNGKTSLRGSFGIFYDWLSTGIYEQSLRVNGFRQRELNIANPSFPDPGSVGTISTTNRYLLREDLPMARNTRVSAGVDQTISPRVRAGFTYAHTTGSGLMRGENLNFPINGVRPNPLFVNIIRVVNDAASRQDVLNAFGSFSLMPQSPSLNGPFGASGPRWNWKRTSVNVNYSTGRLENNTDGPYSLPASGSPAGEWGPVPGEIRKRRFNIGINSSALKNLNANVNFNATTGTPYTITTGHDDNGDLVFNDRPAGVGRNTQWTPGQWTVNGFFNYSIAIGKKTVQNPGGITGITMRNGEISVMTGGAAPPRYRIGISANVINLTNHANFIGYSGTMTSPFFLQPKDVQNMRKVDISLNFSF
jgi:Carboxypeptidase regulatory-like domain/TonB dependent receptor-like, beta-barrel